MFTRRDIAVGWLVGFIAVLTATVFPVATAATTTPRPLAAEPTPTGEPTLRPIPVLPIPEPDPLAQHGGSFRWVTNLDPVNFGIWDSANANTLRPSIPTTDTLLDRNEFEPNKSDQITANLAYDWWTNAEGTTWTFKLRPGVEFSDGVEMTCADLKFSLETIKDGRDGTGATMNASPRAPWFKRVTAIQCADSHTLRVTTDGPLPSLPASLAVSANGVLPRHIFEGRLDLWLTQPNAVGVGPFTFDSYTPLEVYKLKRNANYWNQPYPYLDAFVLYNLGSNTAAVSAFRVGKAEATVTLPKATRDELEAAGKAVVQGKQAGDSFSVLQANWARTPWSDPRFSLALRCAIDSAKVISTAHAGEGFEGPVVPTSSTPGGPAWGITKEQWKSLGPCHGPTDETNMEERRQIARNLLSEIGFSPSTPARPVVVWGDSSEAKTQWASITADLEAVGMAPQVTYVAPFQAYPRAVSGDFDIISPVATLVTSRRDPDHWLYEQFRSTSDRNYGRYTSEEADSLIDGQSRDINASTRADKVRQAVMKLTFDNSKIVLRHSYQVFALAPWVRGLYWGEPFAAGNTSSKLTRAWINVAKMNEVLGTETPTATPTPTPTATPTPSGGISGKVTKADGITPISGISVWAYRWDYSCCSGSTTTGADGTYTITGLTSGDYRVHATGQTYATQYFNGTSDSTLATKVAVNFPNTTAGINFPLVEGGSIAGKVTKEDGITPIAGACLQAVGFVVQVGYTATCTLSDGIYVLGNLPVGDYRVQMYYSGGQGYRLQYYSGASTIADVTKVSVALLQQTPNVNFVLQPGGRVSGRVTKVDGITPLGGIIITAQPYGEPCCLSSATTASDGTYMINGLGGEYKIRASGLNYIQQYYQGKNSLGTADRVIIIPPSATTNIDFALSKPTLTVSKQGTGSGTVSSNPAGINCGVTCSTDFSPGGSVTLTASADSGSAFGGWNGGGCSGTGTCTVTMDTAKSVAATFTLQQASLSVSKAGSGGAVYSDPVGIACDGTCAFSYSAGTVVTLYANTNSATVFTGWSGACSGTGPCQVTMNAAKSVTATFAPAPPPTPVPGTPWPWLLALAAGLGAIVMWAGRRSGRRTAGGTG